MAPVIAAALAEAVRTIGSTRTVDETLTALAETARNSLPGFDQVGVSIIDQNGVIATRAATGQLVRDLDELQYELGEGPCLDGMRSGPIVRAPHIRHDQRWPRFVPRAVELGLKSQLAVKVYTDEDGTIGGLNIYSTTTEDIDPDAPGVADMFATYGAVVFGKVRKLDHLHEALRSRETIGKAVGLLMAKYGLDEDAAFGFLVRTSSHANIKARDIAARVIEDHLAELTSGRRRT